MGASQFCISASTRTVCCLSRPVMTSSVRLDVDSRASVRPRKNNLGLVRSMLTPSITSCSINASYNPATLDWDESCRRKLRRCLMILVLMVKVITWVLSVARSGIQASS